MILFITWRKKLLHGVLSWYLWAEVTIDESIVENYGVFIQKKIRDEKNMLFDNLYTEFSKLKLTRFYSTKSNTLYHNKSLLKDSIDKMMRAAITRKYKNLKKSKI